MTAITSNLAPDLDGEGPLWLQVRRALARPILDGTWQPGAKIPGRDRADRALRRLAHDHQQGPAQPGARRPGGAAAQARHHRRRPRAAASGVRDLGCGGGGAARRRNLHLQRVRAGGRQRRQRARPPPRPRSGRAPAVAAGRALFRWPSGAAGGTPDQSRLRTQGAEGIVQEKMRRANGCSSMCPGPRPSTPSWRAKRAAESRSCCSYAPAAPAWWWSVKPGTAKSPSPSPGYGIPASITGW